MQTFQKSNVFAVLVSATLFAGCLSSTPAAEELNLRSGISFTQDIDNGFPIVADKMEDVSVENGRPTFIFFGASGDLNTNRQARRVVDLYRKNRSSQLKFLVIDVDHATAPACKQLVKEYYRGYIPTQVMLDKSGAKFWSQVGETDNRLMQAQVEKVLN